MKLHTAVLDQQSRYAELLQWIGTAITFTWPSKKTNQSTEEIRNNNQSFMYFGNFMLPVVHYIHFMTNF